ncbi:anti-apoptotic protein NR13-like isoform X2 [Brienomyrus brachyistius]|uniref:anti-apoptotic protein NR13-like isoform X2 n=1 Tax=Brienomyrus brachyistius TaxID=42636 RepID=UPI0020B2F374|nr:anti-apoptotic protein NR13-like isoform X2 [Brienomyrus brachyistius]
MGIMKFACATGVMAAAAGAAYLYRRFRKTPVQEEVNMATSLRDETLIVANDYMQFCMGIRRTPPSESAKAMRYLAKEVEYMYGIELRHLMQSFLITCHLNTWTKLRSVMLDMTDNEDMSWGQVVILFAFTGILAVQMSAIDEDVSCCRRLAEMITDVLCNEKEEWMIQNGGWRGFVDYTRIFSPRYPESPALLTAAKLAVAFLLICYLLKRTLPCSVPSSCIIIKQLPGT